MTEGEVSIHTRGEWEGSQAGEKEGLGRGRQGGRDDIWKVRGCVQKQRGVQIEEAPASTRSCDVAAKAVEHIKKFGVAGTWVPKGEAMQAITQKNIMGEIPPGALAKIVGLQVLLLVSIAAGLERWESSRRQQGVFKKRHRMKSDDDMLPACLHACRWASRLGGRKVASIGLVIERVLSVVVSGKPVACMQCALGASAAGPLQRLLHSRGVASSGDEPRRPVN